ncbi:MAG: hypothetical protein KC501_24450 [Myxococcales bacterium]|nr:hypothetical protein [Myxococcales bacterium]
MSGALASSLLAGGCNDDPPPSKLFDESGAWSVIKYDIDGSGDLNDVDVNNRRDAFMLHFDNAERVVTTAACVENENETPANSTCLLTPTTTQWICRCFGYAFKDDRMLWREFEPGDVPPTLGVDDIDAPAADGMADTDTGGGMAAGDDTLIILGEIMDINSTYNYRPLPTGVFGSNGEDSRFVLQARAGSVFDRAYDDPDGRPSCEPCVP